MMNESFKSDPMAMTCGIPQGSILEPLLFSLYILLLGQIGQKTNVGDNGYAEDTAIFSNFQFKFKSWMKQNFLQLKVFQNRIQDKLEIKAKQAHAHVRLCNFIYECDKLVARI